MRGIRVVKPLEFKKVDLSKPVLDENNNILVKMKAVGICGSDVHIYHGQNAAATYPRIIGHEMVGEVEEVYSNVSSIKPGSRVIIDQVINCGTCYACSHDRGNVCKELKVRGVHVDGGFQEYIAVPESSVYLLPENLSNEEAVMIEPLTIAIQSCSRAELKDDDTLIILGYGALGSSLLKVAKLSKTKIIVIDVMDEKLKDAKSSGADYTINLLKEDVLKRVLEITDNYGATVSIDAACTQDSLATLLKLTGNAGRIITMGFSLDPTEINQFSVTSREIDIRGSRLQNKKFGEAIDLIKTGKINLTGSISHIFNFSDTQHAFDFIDSKDPSIKKIVLKFE